MKFEKILPIIAHLIFILSGMFIVFWILDKYNPLMGFISGNISMALLLVFAALAFLNSVLTIIYFHFVNKNENELIKLGGKRIREINYNA